MRICSKVIVLVNLVMVMSGAPCGQVLAAQGERRLNLAVGDKKPFLVVMVDTKQSKFDVSTQTVSSWIFPSTTNHYTMQDWIRVNFGGQVSIVPCNESCDAKNDGVVKVAVDSDDPSLDTPRTMEEICKMAMVKAAPYLDVTPYDVKKTGQIGPPQLGVLFLFAKPKFAGGGTSFGFYKIPLPVLNGVKLDGFEFICAPPSRDNIGAIIHDWLHLYGEKDFYSHDKTRFGVSNLHLGFIWKGGRKKDRNTPSNLMPMSIENFGILKPEVISVSGEYELRAWSTGKYNYLKIPTSDPGEYFLLENRQFDGFDECLGNDISSPGIAIYHVDRKQALKGNFNNDDKDHRLVTIEAANEGKYGFNEYNVIKGTNTTDHNILWHQDMVFGPATVPNTGLYSGKASGISVKVLNTNGSVMKIRVDLGRGES